MGRRLIALITLAGFAAAFLGPALQGAGAASVSPCGDASAPTGWTAATQWSDITGAVSGLSSTGSASIYLATPTITAPAGDALDIPQGASVTIDLCGDDLTVISPPPNMAAVNVPAASGETGGSSLTVEDTSTSDVASQGKLIATGGPDVQYQNSVINTNDGSGAGAGIGGDHQQSNGSVTVLSGNVVATGGSAYGVEGYLFGGAGAGIGGGGAAGGGIQASTGPAGGGGGTVNLLGGSVSATGGGPYVAGTYGTTGGAGAGIGGGGGAYDNAGGTTSGSGAALEIAGASVTAIGGQADCLTAHYCGASAAGVGPGGAGAFGAVAGADGTATVAAGSAGHAVSQLAGSAQDPVTVNAGATLEVPSNDTLTLSSATNTNDGTVQVAGDLMGSGSLANAGAIVVTSTGELPADGLGDSPGDLTVTGNIFKLTFTLASGVSGAPPSPQWVYAATVKADGGTLPKLRVPSGDTGAWDSGHTPVIGTTALKPFSSTVAGVPTVALTESYGKPPKLSYKLSSAKSKTAFGWYGAPVKITFDCSPAKGATISCPKPVVISNSGLHPAFTQPIPASDDANSSIKVSEIKLDTSRPKLSVTGVKSGATYHEAPKVKCAASDRISGVASCKLSTKKVKVVGGYREKVTAKATSKAGLTSQTTVVFTVKHG